LNFAIHDSISVVTGTCDQLMCSNNNNNNNHDSIYSAVIIAEPLREFTRFTRWIQKL